MFAFALTATALWGLADARSAETAASPLVAESLFAGPVLAEHLGIQPAARTLSKKHHWVEEKTRRRDIHVSDADLARAARVARVARRVSPSSPRKLALETSLMPGVGHRIQPVTTLFNLKLRESLPILPGQLLDAGTYTRFHALLRDHYTNQATRMDDGLLGVLAEAAVNFDAGRVDIVSGYRSPKYNINLRKKGREVARDSQHTQGKAVDFRIRGVATKDLWRFVRSLGLGGVGLYPHSGFVHCDTGPIRFWSGS